jgi:hypothetical protein
MPRRLLALLLLVVLGAGAAGAAPAGAADSAEQRARVARLGAFGSCQGLVRYARRQALRTRAIGGIAAQPAAPLPVTREGDTPVAQPVAAGDTFSGTNVQEVGVDEPDLVKTDGARVFALAGSALNAVDVTGEAPRLVGSLDLGETSGHELFLHEGRVLVVSQRFGSAEPDAPAPRPVPPDATTTAPAQAGAPVTVLTEIDVRDAGAMRVVRTVEAEGTPVSARLTGATARVVLTSAPSLLATTRRAIRRTRLATWLPGSVIRNAATGRERSRRLVRCSAVRRPRAFSGLGMLTVLTVDMKRGLPWVDSDAIMSDGQIVYGSPGSLYVATQRWIDPSTPADGLPQVGTQIHRFAAADAGSTEYRATGEVPGHLLNQFAMSEHDGVLRVASTETPVWIGGQETRESESVVTVLAEDGSRLRPVGSLRGLGRGERIYAVRFIEDAGYVVTFRQVDPLYTLDLSTPSAPRLAGELKIPGYSAYLHPLGDGLLLGVGQDATDEGRLTGTQLSLFDVSDPARPARLQQRTIASSGGSEAEYDHRAFLYWAPARLAVLPVETFDEDRGTAGFAGALGFRLDPAAPIAEVGRATHPEGAPVRRSLVVGERLFTLSERGLLASSLADLAPLTWVPFPAP